MNKHPLTPPAIHTLKHLAGLETLAIDHNAFDRHCQALHVRGYCRRAGRDWVITPAGRQFLAREMANDR